MQDGMPLEDMGDYLRLYIDETEEQLDALVQTLLALEQDPGDTRQLNESFRLIHSIKGSSALLGLDRVTTLTHHLESHFERLRAGSRVLDAATMGVVLRCIDFLRECNGRLRAGQPLDQPGDLLDRVKALEHSAGRRTAASTPHRAVDETAAPATRPESEPDSSRESWAADATADATGIGPDGRSHAPPDTSPGDEPTWRVSLRFRANLPMPEMKAELMLVRFASIGSVIGSIPSRESLAAGGEGLERLVILVSTPADQATIRATCDADGVEVESLEELPANDPTAGRIGSSRIHLPEDIVEHAEAEPFGDTGRSGGGGGTRHGAAAPVAGTVRVDVERLDVLLNLTGELVVSRARLAQIAADIAPTFRKSGLGGRSAIDSVKELVRSADAARTPTAGILAELDEHLALLGQQARALEEGRQRFGELVAAIDQLSRVSDSLQRGVLETRMVPIGPLFNRFRRSVRDIAGELGKTVVLEVVGEKTELDKRMIDEIGDPLNHLIRNSIDHGIESADVRHRRGKPEAATVRLTATHRGSNVFITVEDDGGGIDTARVRQIAVNRGLLSQETADGLGESEVIDLIWEPGFSTAASVSDISGRGVGMDIVRTRIAALNGSIEVASSAGTGTVFTIRLPLTLTITRCMLFRLPEGVFAVAIENVREIVAAASHQVVGVNGRDLVDVRGEFLPLVGIHDLFDWHGADRHSGADNVVLLHAGGRTIGLRVESLLGGQDLVVKPFDENFVPIRGLGGASILGDGSICLLLDVAACIELSERGRPDRSSTGAA